MTRRTAVAVVFEPRANGSANALGARRMAAGAGSPPAGFRSLTGIPPAQFGTLRRLGDEPPARLYPSHPGCRAHRRGYSHAGGNVRLEPFMILLIYIRQLAWICIYSSFHFARKCSMAARTRVFTVPRGQPSTSAISLWLNP